jgi:aspartate carbamoyltransferase regulatory subunit
MPDREPELRVMKIKDGTVIDHVKAGYAPSVLQILGVTKGSEKVVTMAMNVASSRTGKKDIVKVEGRELKRSELNKISLITPDATVNIIKDYRVERKVTVSLPDLIEGTVACINPNCITNAGEPIQATFGVSRNPLRLRCTYCGKFLEEREVMGQF